VSTDSPVGGIGRPASLVGGIGRPASLVGGIGRPASPVGGIGRPPRWSAVPPVMDDLLSFE